MKAFGPLLLRLLVLVGGAQCTLLKMCYFNCRGNVYQGERSFMRVSDIDHTLCTDLVWAHGYLELRAIRVDPCHSKDPPCWKRWADFHALKGKNPELRLWMSVDGQTTEDFRKNKVQSFVFISGDPDKRNVFAIKVSRFLRDAQYTGLILDWDLPNIRAGTDKYFLDLILRLQVAFNVPDTEGPLFLAAAFSAISYDIIHAYRPQQFYPHLTYMILKTYDYHLLRTKETAFSSPLKKRSPSYPNLNMYNTLSAYLSSWKIPAEKIVVGLSFKGTRYILTHEDHTRPGEPATLDMRNNTMFRLKGAMTFPEVCIMLSQKQTSKFFDSQQECPYIVYDNFWIGYEDHVSIWQKIKYLKRMNVRGVMMSDIEMDDVWGMFCKQGKYPLLKALQRSIGGPMRGRGFVFINDNTGASPRIAPVWHIVLISLFAGTLVR